MPKKATSKSAAKREKVQAAASPEDAGQVESGAEGSQGPENTGPNSHLDAHGHEIGSPRAASSTGTPAGKIEGKATDHVAVEHFHSSFRKPLHRVFSKDVHGKDFAKVALEFSASNPWPATNSSGLALPNGQAERQNSVRYVDEAEAQQLHEELQGEHAAVNARRDEQLSKGHKVTP